MILLLATLDQHWISEQNYKHISTIVRVLFMLYFILIIVVFIVILSSFYYDYIIIIRLEIQTTLTL